MQYPNFKRKADVTGKTQFGRIVYYRKPNIAKPSASFRLLRSTAGKPWDYSKKKPGEERRIEYMGLLANELLYRIGEQIRIDRRLNDLGFIIRKIILELWVYVLELGLNIIPPGLIKDEPKKPKWGL